MLRVVSGFRVETVDLQKFTWPQDLIFSFKKTGFAVIKNHKIEKSLLDSVYSDWAQFFASPSKKHFKTENGVNGYFPFKSENAKGNPVKDIKEFYHVFAPFDMDSRPSPWIGDTTKQLADEMLGLSRHLLFVLQKEISNELFEIHGQPLHLMSRDSSQNLLRILKYPKLADYEEGAVRAAAHEDINLITLLPAATQPGLEVQDLSGEWHKVPCEPGQIIVNVGDMLEEASGGIFKSTTHRVVNPDKSENNERFSMPLFVHPKSEVRLSKRYTAGQYLDERLKEIGLK